MLTAPRATYRVQLNREFTLADAARAVPYLASLGISHLYASPLLKARAGSMHGYDVTDHRQLNPELGTPEDLKHLVVQLRDHGMGLIVDIVPNHLGVFGSENAWWLDLLENGPVAQYAPHFDIDWRPNRASLKDRLLVPVLGETYGEVLESGELKLEFDAARGEFSFHYHDHTFPIDPREYPRIFSDSAPANALDEISAADLASLLSAFAQLPARNVTTEDARNARYRDKEAHKRRLVRLMERDPAVREFIEATVTRINGTPGVAASFDALDALHDAQAYRLAYWRVAADEINYRRFFDVNSLAALRMNDPEVFRQTHALIIEWAQQRLIDGLRIDHSDGLFDPEAYFSQLRAATTPAGGPAPYVVTEKILAPHERLRESWAIDGTTGYEFGALVTGWLVDSAGEQSMTQTYAQFGGRTERFEDVAYASRKLVMRILLAPEIEALATQLDRIAQADRHTADFTRPALREAIIEVMACFPVYRTYLSERGSSPEDEREIGRAVAMARRRSIAADTSVFGFLHEVLLAKPQREVAPTQRAAMVDFAMKFQQVSAPVTAKGVEDTALYRFNRLVCLNDVGCDPRRFGLSTQAVHAENAERMRRWPRTLLATSTHDSKRSEDVRARLAVLSELPSEWRARVNRWARLNRSKRVTVNDVPAPDADDEYLIYQSLLGIWDPVVPAEQLAERLQQYAIKAAREAKRCTSWLNVDEAYEEALRRFVAKLLERRGRNAFLHDFAKFATLVSHFGHLNSLSQCLLKLTAPGTPDIYQGCERLAFALVDPDNRRRVDFDDAQQRLASLQEGLARSPREQVLRQLLDDACGGDAKLFLTSQLLRLRKQRPALFAEGRYESLSVDGDAMETYVAAFARIHEGQCVVVVVTRGSCRRMGRQSGTPLAGAWQGATVNLGELAGRGEWTEYLSGRKHAERAGSLPLDQVLSDWPLAVLLPLKG